MMLRDYRDFSQSPDRLIETHLNLARRIAWHMHARVGKRMEIDDLLQVAYAGLMDAARRYVAQPGVSFAAYAGIRIRGALLDHLRSMAGQARASLQMQGKLSLTEQRLSQKLLRQPTEAEIAKEMNMTIDELSKWRTEIDSGRQSSLDEVYTDHSMIFRDQTPSAEDQLAKDMLKRKLRDAVTQLPEREALVLQLYFVEELNVYEVAEVLKVTTGRVSQIKKAAIERLRKLLEPELD